MHSFHSKRTLLRLHLGSLFFLVFVASVAAVLPAVIHGLIMPGKTGFYVAMILLVSSIVCGLLFLVISAGVRCPLCHAPLLSGAGFSRNQKASRIFGSHRLATSLGVLFRGSFRCCGCGEPCRCAVRKR